MIEHAENSSLPSHPGRPLLRLLNYLGPHRRQVWLASLTSFLNKVFDLAPPLLIGVAVDVVVKREDSMLAGFGLSDPATQLIVLAVITVVIWGLESVFEYIFKVLWKNLAQSVEHELRIEAYTHIQDLDIAWFESRSSGELMSVLNDDVNQLERFLDHGANDLIQVGTTVVVIGAVFFALAPSVAWMSFVPVPLILYGSFRYQAKLTPLYAAVRDQVGMLNSRLANNLGGITTIKSFTAEQDEVQRVRDESDHYRQANHSAIRFASAFVPLIRMVIVTGFIATLIAGGAMALDGRLEVGAFSVMVFLTQRLLWPLTRLGETFDLYQRAMASTKRILDLLNEEATIKEGATELPIDEVRGEIELEDVCFTYSNGAQVLRDISLRIPAGDTVAIVGATGSGKTTLIKLLMRFYDVSEGRIMLDGHDLRDLTQRTLRQAVGLVSQDVFLFHGTVAENIRYGRPDAPLKDVVAAAELAEADDFIRALPQGYDTVVGERGQLLSGGQRQRISIARAILKSPPILVFDEATSAVDNETEAAIQRSLDRVSAERTTIVIAHRLSTIRSADTIYVLDAGSVAEAGKHDELLRAGGLYASLWQVQTGEREAAQRSA